MSTKAKAQESFHAAHITPKVDYVRPGYARGAPIPWQIKMVLKITLAHMPVSYDFWRRMGIFRHGDISTKLPNLQKGFQETIEYYQQRFGRTPQTCLELGPGDSVGHALSGFAAGVKQTWLVDVGDFAEKDAGHYRSFCDYLQTSGGVAFPLPEQFDRESILEHTNSKYMTRGLADLKTIPDQVVEYSFSSAVLEHIRRTEFADHMRELFRIHKRGGFSRHWVDLHDHLGGRLDSMRFSSGFWEGSAVGRAGFYTNRLTMQEMVDMAAEAGFKANVERIIKWNQLPTHRSAMHGMFRQKEEEELNICTFLLILQKD